MHNNNAILTKTHGQERSHFKANEQIGTIWVFSGSKTVEKLSERCYLNANSSVAGQRRIFF